MFHGAALRKTGTGWEFSREEALEDFLEDNLQELLRLTPLKRQHHVWQIENLKLSNFAILN